PDACKMALVRPITDDADIRQTLDRAINAVFA
ncbi:MAG TPA: AAA family ATPase, partial [Leucothrix sp.]|nr:AAA family ATPase [Leucothrix sp.]